MGMISSWCVDKGCTFRWVTQRWGYYKQLFRFIYLLTWKMLTRNGFGISPNCGCVLEVGHVFVGVGVIIIILGHRFVCRTCISVLNKVLWTGFQASTGAPHRSRGWLRCLPAVGVGLTWRRGSSHGSCWPVRWCSLTCLLVANRCLRRRKTLLVVTHCCSSGICCVIKLDLLLCVWSALYYTQINVWWRKIHKIWHKKRVMGLGSGHVMLHYARLYFYFFIDAESSTDVENDRNEKRWTLFWIYRCRVPVSFTNPKSNADSWEYVTFSRWLWLWQSCWGGAETEALATFAFWVCLYTVYSRFCVCTKE